MQEGQQDTVILSQQQANSVNAPLDSEDAGISWSASEFIAHAKAGSWYAIVIAVSLALAVLAYFFADIVTVVIILFLGIVFCVVGARTPRELPYHVDTNGIKIDQKFYPYSAFKSFSIVQEEGIESIWFMPLQRFAPGLSIYFAPQEGQKIVDYLGKQLPYEPKELDFFDSLMHRIRF